uniref:Coat protein n=1 Tax=Palo verde broom virus TaxID=2175800 RepID=A0A2S1R3A0_9VIRU|nr:coat protein [Palo verde broom virus]
MASKLKIQLSKTSKKSEKTITVDVKDDKVQKIDGSKTFTFVAMGEQSTDGYNIRNLVRSIDCENALKYITNSDILNARKKSGAIQEFKWAGSTLFVVPDLKPTSAKNVMSYHRFMALCAAAVWIKHGRKVWSDSDEYKSAIEDKDVNDIARVEQKYGNKLGYAAGFARTNIWHWFYVTGYEYTFPLFPAEVIAMTMFKWAHKDELKIKLEKKEIVTPTIRQILRWGDFKITISKIKKERIIHAYKEIVKDRSGNEAEAKYDDLMELFSEIKDGLDDEEKTGELADAFKGVNL